MPKYKVELQPIIAIPYVYDGDLAIEAESKEEAKQLAIYDFMDDFDMDFRENGFDMFEFRVAVTEVEADNA